MREYGKILDLGITSNVKFPNTFGHPIRLGFPLEAPGFGELLPRVCVGPREPSRPYAIGSNAELHHNTHRSSIGNLRKAALAWICRVRISGLRKEVPKTPASQNRKLAQTAAASHLNMNQPMTSALSSYHLDGFSVERRMIFF